MNLKFSKSPFTRQEILGVIAEETKQMRSRNVWGIYARQSHYEPEKPGYSMEVQPEVTEEYARANGATDVIVFEDPGKSGKNSARDALQDMRLTVISGKLDVVAFHRIDRAFRNLESLLTFVRFLKKYNVRLVSVTEQIDTDTWWGRLVLAVLGSLAEAYVWQVSGNTRLGLNKRGKDGLHRGDIPLGYCNGLCATCNDVNGKDYCPLYGGLDRPESQRGRLAVPHPVDCHVIPMIHELAFQGLSDREISNLLNTSEYTLPGGSQVQFRPRGSKKKRKQGLSTFTRESVRAILENPFYSGQIAFYRRPDFSLEDNFEHPENIPTSTIKGDSREIIDLQPGQHEALISFETWQSSISLRRSKGNSPIQHNSARKTRIYPLSAVGRCWECFETLDQDFSLRGSMGGKGIMYYRCAYDHDHSLRGTKKKASRMEGLNPLVDTVDHELSKRHKYLNALRIETQVDRLMEKLIIPRIWDEWLAAYFLSDTGIAEFERAGYLHRQEMQQLADLHKAGHIGLPDLEKGTRVLQDKLNNLKPTAKPEARQMVEKIRPFSAFWHSLNPIEKRKVLGTIFAGLYFDREGRLIRALAYEPFNELLDIPEDGLLTEQEV